MKRLLTVFYICLLFSLFFLAKPSLSYAGCTTDAECASGQACKYVNYNGQIPIAGTGRCEAPGQTTQAAGGGATVDSCPVCEEGYIWSTKDNACEIANDPNAPKKTPKERKPCAATGVCLAGCGCSISDCAGNTGAFANLCQGGRCSTALGSISTSPLGIIQSLFGLVLSISGGVALLLIILSGYRILSSRGDPEALKGAREQLTAAIVGLLFIIFALVILQLIGYDILRIPGFGNSATQTFSSGGGIYKQ